MPGPLIYGEKMEIVHYGNPVLREKAEEVPSNMDLNSFIDEMFDLMYKSAGIGLAAPQVGESLRFFITDFDGQSPMVFINPRIIERKGEKTAMDEGCLSFPGLGGQVIRPSQVIVEAENRERRPFKLEASELLAKVIQHEYDHINGVLFIDRLETEEKEEIKSELKALATRTRKSL